MTEDRIRELNREHRALDEPTDVLSFPIDGAGDVAGPTRAGRRGHLPRAHRDVTEATVHGVLHLCGYDHESDSGEMLGLQARVLMARGCCGAMSVSGLGR